MTRRLLISYLIVTALVLVLLEVPLAVFYAQRERERIAADVEHDASVLATFYEDDLEGDGPLDSVPADEYRDRTGARVVVVDRDGISRVDTDQTVDRDFSTRPEIELALAGNTAEGTRSSETLETDLLYVAVPVASGGVVHGAVRVTLDTSDVNARIHRFWRSLAGIAAVVLVVVAVVGWGIARSVTRPIRRLNSDASRFAGGDLTVNTEPINGPPEVRALADTMSTMARRLDELLRSQRTFVADASHQLRTPLTALRLRLDNLQSRLPAQSSTELDAAIDETTRLAALVTSLLQLAHADEHPAIGVADLARLTIDRVDTWTAVASPNAVTLIADTPPRSVLVKADPARHRTDPRQPPRQRPQRITPRVHDHRPHHVPPDHPRPDNQRSRPRASRQRKAPGNPTILAREHNHVRHRTRPRHRRIPRHRIPRQDPPRRRARRRPRRHRHIPRRQPGNSQPITPRPEFNQRASCERLPSTRSSPAPRGSATGPPRPGTPAIDSAKNRRRHPDCLLSRASVAPVFASIRARLDGRAGVTDCLVDRCGQTPPIPGVDAERVAGPFGCGCRLDFLALVESPTVGNVHGDSRVAVSFGAVA